MASDIELYDRVILDTVPDCPGELILHGIRPFMARLTGQVVRIAEGAEPYRDEYADHFYEVATSDGHHGWFAARELRRLYDAIQDGTWPHEKTRPKTGP